MSEAGNGSAILAGNPASAPAAAGNAGAAAAAAPAETGAVSNQADTSTGAWYDQIQDTDLRGYLQNKGWKEPADMAVGYRNLEKLVGQDKVALPKSETDVDGWSRVYDALGRPKTADDYKLPVPEGQSGDFAKEAASKFHELGISAKQASALAEWWNKTHGGALEQHKTKMAQQSEADVLALKSEWGGAWDENVELGRRAAREFGLSVDKLTKIENAVGTKDVMQLMAKIGRGLTEHEFETGRSTTSFGMTPEAARARILDLRADKDWAAKYLQGGADQKAEMSRLMALAYPDAAPGG